MDFRLYGTVKKEAVVFASPRNAAAFLTLCSVSLNKKGAAHLTPATFVKVD